MLAFLFEVSAKIRQPKTFTNQLFLSIPCVKLCGSILETRIQVFREHFEHFLECIFTEENLKTFWELDGLCPGRRVGFLRSLGVFGFCLRFLVLSWFSGFLVDLFFLLVSLGSCCLSVLVFFGFLGFCLSLGFSGFFWFLRFFGWPGSPSPPGFCSPLWVHGVQTQRISIEMLYFVEKRFGLYLTTKNDQHRPKGSKLLRNRATTVKIRLKLPLKCENGHNRWTDKSIFGEGYWDVRLDY